MRANDGHVTERQTFWAHLPLTPVAFRGVLAGRVPKNQGGRARRDALYGFSSLAACEFCGARSFAIASRFFRITARRLRPGFEPSMRRSSEIIHSGRFMRRRKSRRYGWILAYWKYISWQVS